MDCFTDKEDKCGVQRSKRGKEEGKKGEEMPQDFFRSRLVTEKKKEIVGERKKISSVKANFCQVDKLSRLTQLVTESIRRKSVKLTTFPFFLPFLLGNRKYDKDVLHG